jgi:hypothetical protein
LFGDQDFATASDGFFAGGAVAWLPFGFNEEVGYLVNKAKKEIKKV